MILQVLIYKTYYNIIKMKIFAKTVENRALRQTIALRDVYNNNHIRVMPDVHAGKGCTIGTTMIVKDRIDPNLVGVDIGCLDKDTEFLTKEGWKKISDYNHGDYVLQYNKDDDTAKFVIPLHYIVKDCKEFIHFKNDRGLDQMVSNEHKMLIWKGGKKRGYILSDYNAEEFVKLGDKLKKGYYGIKTAFNIIGEGLDLTDNEIRLDVMITADGCIKYDKGDSHQIYLHLKKERKIKRAIDILNKNGIEYKLTDGGDGSTHIYCYVSKKFNKDLSKYWRANKQQLNIVAEESLLWDGHKGYRSYFSSCNKTSADIIQFAFTSNNIRAGISINKSSKWNDVYCVTPTKNNVIGVYHNDIKGVKSLDGKKYCFTMPSGYFVARRNGRIFITGNCGISLYKLKDKITDFHKLHQTIEKKIPHGKNINVECSNNPIIDCILSSLKCKNHINLDRAYKSIGTLGGGNHFIEVGTDAGNQYILIHSGSRNLGVQVCNYYSKLKSGRRNEIERIIREENPQDRQRLIKAIPEYCGNYLEGQDLEDYLNDMRLVKKYAAENRAAIFANLGVPGELIVDSVHNYIDCNRILRKGACAAYINQLFVVPLNMRFGTLICKGKGNSDWNYSAPHGAGRVMSRNKAKEKLSFKEFKEQMKDIYSETVCESTLDEAPLAYKQPIEIIKAIQPTANIEAVITPIFNFKSK